MNYVALGRVIQINPTLALLFHKASSYFLSWGFCQRSKIHVVFLCVSLYVDFDTAKDGLTFAVTRYMKVLVYESAGQYLGSEQKYGYQVI